MPELAPLAAAAGRTKCSVAQELIADSYGLYGIQLVCMLYFAWEPLTPLQLDESD